jgi:hypothetical protein
MKSVFKKWVEFEEKHGDADTLIAVKEKAVEFVESATKYFKCYGIKLLFVE